MNTVATICVVIVAVILGVLLLRALGVAL